MSQERERKPYNPYHLASGHAAKSLPDKKTAAIFARLCNHTDYLGGSVSCSIETIARETKYSPRAVNNAVKILKKLGRVSKKARGIAGQVGGRKSSITTVHCTEAELKAAGANEENYFGRGGSSGLIKTQIEPNQNAKRTYSKRKQDEIKTQRSALEPLKSEPFLPQPIKAEPLKAGANQSQPQEIFTSSRQGKKENQSQPREPQENPTPAGIKNQLKGSAPRREPPAKHFLIPEVAAKMKSLGFPEPVIAEITKMEHWSKALNNTSNVLSSYETLAMKPNAFASKMFDLWMPKRILSGFGDDCYDQGSEESILKENARPKEERIAEEAVQWFCFLDEDRQHELIDFPAGYKTFFKAAKDKKAEIVTAYLADLEERRRFEHERIMKLSREAK